MSSSASPLLDLAPELRNEIYHYALSGHGRDVKISIAGNDYHHALLRTCKQIRNEALPVWYANTSFRVTADSTNTSGPFTWLSHIHADDQKLIKKVVVEWNVSLPEERIFKAAGPLSRLDRLESYKEKMFDRGKNSVKLLAPFLTSLRHAGVEMTAISCGFGDIPDDRYAIRHTLLGDYHAEVETLVAKIYSA